MHLDLSESFLNGVDRDGIQDFRWCLESVLYDGINASLCSLEKPHLINLRITLCVFTASLQLYPYIQVPLCSCLLLINNQFIARNLVINPWIQDLALCILKCQRGQYCFFWDKLFSESICYNNYEFTVSLKAYCLKDGNYCQILVDLLTHLKYP